MSTITIFGATGYAGGHIAAIAAERGHDVVAVSRHATREAVPDATEVRSLSIHDSAQVAGLIADSDVVVIALKASAEDDEGRRLIDALPHVLESAAAAGTRIGVVGGAGSLHESADGPLLMDTADFPAAVLPESRAHKDVLDLLRTDSRGASWFYVSPAQLFGAHFPGERTGHYRLGDDVLVRDEAGRSAISGADLAIAIVDEIDSPRHHDVRFTVGY
ncbi:NAD(P)-dependent oxidoreductase [Demequina salsinemoris]|uniref:NAD(P)-dependent oxidoreductase n=1 Tax=Demequina salsinemoris TaxID=577470 RepID=UPI0007806626|nr:NAD(P)H-binding protein [Demequina salsinemoris]